MLHRRRLNSETLANVLSQYYSRPISSQPKKVAMKTILPQWNVQKAEITLSYEESFLLTATI